MSTYLRTNYRLTGGQLEGAQIPSVFVTTFVSFSAPQGSYYTAIENILGFSASVRVIGAYYALDHQGTGSYGWVDCHVTTSYGTAAESVLLYIQARQINAAGTATISTAMNPICTTSIGGNALSDVTLAVDFLVISAAEAFA